MEEKDCSPFGVAVRDEEAPQGFRVEQRSDNPNPNPNPNLNQIGEPANTMVPAATQASPMPVSVVMPSTEVKKKRGRPRKYGPDGTPLALSPMPISSSIPLTGDFSAWKRSKGKPIESIKKSHKHEVFGSPGDRIAYSLGANFTPHVITVNAGEDVTMKVMSFSQQVARAICILSANGTISNVTLRQPTSSGGTLIYEGRFEILSLSGSFMPTENAGTKSRSGGMSVSLAGPDGRVLGGGLAGLLVASGPVQVVVGSFLPGHQLEQKPKKQRTDPFSMSTHITHSLSSEEIKGSYGGLKPIMTSTAFHANNTSPNHVHANNTSPNHVHANNTSPNHVHANNTSPNHVLGGINNFVPENKSSLPEEESKGLNHTNCEVYF